MGIRSRCHRPSGSSRSTRLERSVAQRLGRARQWTGGVAPILLQRSPLIGVSRTCKASTSTPRCSPPANPTRHTPVNPERHRLRVDGPATPPRVTRPPNSRQKNYESGSSATRCRGFVPRARCDEAGFVGQCDELCAVVAVELGEDATDVRLGGEGLITSRLAMSALLRPAATSRRISRSRSVSLASCAVTFVDTGVPRTRRSGAAEIMS